MWNFLFFSLRTVTYLMYSLDLGITTLYGLLGLFYCPIITTFSRLLHTSATCTLSYQWVPTRLYWGRKWDKYSKKKSMMRMGIACKGQHSKILHIEEHSCTLPNETLRQTRLSFERESSFNSSASLSNNLERKTTHALLCIDEGPRHRKLLYAFG